MGGGGKGSNLYLGPGPKGGAPEVSGDASLV